MPAPSNLPQPATHATEEPALGWSFDTRDIGRKAAEMLLERINGYDGPPREVIFQPSLEIRASTMGRP